MAPSPSRFQYPFVMMLRAGAVTGSTKPTGSTDNVPFLLAFAESGPSPTLVIGHYDPVTQMWIETPMPQMQRTPQRTSQPTQEFTTMLTPNNDTRSDSNPDTRDDFYED